MVIQTINTVSLDSSQGPTSESSLKDARETSSETTLDSKEAFDATFAAQVEQVVTQADALNNDMEREKLSKVLYKYKASFAKDSLDCGLTTIHSVRIPTPHDAPPTYVRQYKIPLASYEPVQEIIDDLLEKGIVRPCNSTYSAPLWPVLKPNGKWRLTIDYRKLNQQVPLSRWPMTQLGQELPKIRDAKYFSSMDIASGFWTLPVHVEDQHKLAFTFANRQYTFTRCPFGYANSPAEFNIFLNKACPDALGRGTLIYVDDILIRSPTLDSHLDEMDHVLAQLTQAGAKVSLSKCQWCKTKVNYVGLLVGPYGVEPQVERVQGITNIKAPTNLSELRSFLGVCNYSRQFIENYADLAKPLTELLKKDTPFIWSEPQEQAMQALKEKLCMAPCLAYPDCTKQFHLEVGFSTGCMSAGLYQLHDHDKRVVAYASKTLLAPEIKYTDCEKALLATVWAVKHFSNYLGGQKVIVETHHQPVTFLNSQRIREGVVTNARVAAWLMALQSFDMEVRYAQNNKTPLGTGLATCHRCTDDVPQSTTLVLDPMPTEPSNHHYFDQNVCQDMITAYVDGCSFHHELKVRAGVGLVWVHDIPIKPQRYNLGSQSSQYAEIAGVLITLQMAAIHKVQTLVICTDSNYARLSFSCHLPLWKRNGFITSNRKPVKHKELFMASDGLVDTHNMQVYWKKVRGHSRVPGQDKVLNDLTDTLAKQGALDGTLWQFDLESLPSPPNPVVHVVTRTQAATATPDGPPNQATISVEPSFSDSDLEAQRNTLHL
uniref:ribonuclease H n=1 Tax=Dicentrarchus labrax TaxID=13489 RepID=A0A8P4K5A8_DICLA